MVARMVGRFGWRDVLLFVLAFFVAILVYRAAVTQTRFVTQGKEAHDYLCYQKKVVIPGRINSSLKYLVDVQEGRRKPVPGITTADIQSSVERDEAVIRALSRVSC